LVQELKEQVLTGLPPTTFGLPGVEPRYLQVDSGTCTRLTAPHFHLPEFAHQFSIGAFQ